MYEPCLFSSVTSLCFSCFSVFRGFLRCFFFPSPFLWSETVHRTFLFCCFVKAQPQLKLRPSCGRGLSGTMKTTLRRSLVEFATFCYNSWVGQKKKIKGHRRLDTYWQIDTNCINLMQIVCVRILSMSGLRFQKFRLPLWVELHNACLHCIVFKSFGPIMPWCMPCSHTTKYLQAGGKMFKSYELHKLAIDFPCFIDLYYIL